MMAPVSGTACTKDRWMSPVPGGRSTSMMSSSPQSASLKLFQGLAGHGSAPSDGLVGLREEADAEQLHAVALHRHDPVLAVLLYAGRVSQCSTSNISGMLGPWISASTRPTFQATRRQTHREVGGDGALAHTTLSTGDGDDVLHMRQAPCAAFRVRRSRGSHFTITFTSLPSACCRLKVTASSMRLRLCMAGLLTSTCT
jgi:hypothetical protein